LLEQGLAAELWRRAVLIAGQCRELRALQCDHGAVDELHAVGMRGVGRRLQHDADRAAWHLDVTVRAAHVARGDDVGAERQDQRVDVRHDAVAA
jgi:hypothetical protein